MEYDLNGNISNLKRSAQSQQGASAFNIDDLGYIYTGNRLTSVTDSSTDYRGYPDTSGNPIRYDSNGNMISHRDKGILQIDYNFLNLPKYIKFDNFITTRAGKIYVNTAYTYRADGVKVGKQYSYKNSSNITHLFNERTDYLDGFQYTNELLKFVPTSEGYYNFENNKYIYNYTDHLGNIRLSYFNNGSGAEVLEENNYYPFGMKHEAYNVLPGNPVYKYSYNGKELQTESGLYDYGARFYMADIGRWGVVDPLAEKSTRFSPYNYAVNNPIRFIDPDGRSGKDIIILTENGSFKASKDLMYKTEEGKRIWDKYGTSKTDDVYIKSSTFSSEDSRTGAETYSLTGDESFVKDGKINDIGKTYSAMESFDGVDISKSGDKQVHLMAINESFFPNKASDTYSKSEVTSSGKTLTSQYDLSDLTKIVYHEFKAHIEDRTGDADKDHKKFGESSFKGYIRPNSPMDIFEKQLIKVVRTLNEKKYNAKK
ncbi:RHS repeat-associated core domain-containing protein [Chryseobacterium sp. PS-8]|uniref:RHS repeat-associated core domain-containing protein n=1 Tax=Chryseobacterium indicum TaxID=2766954 RepID=A0ABS9C8S7_9FLAO|nr:RHS repeat-associated core domain-containing protein [Chryseobacterium sp. PS-8]MCF2220370.1 RHS repeat-associated core domain-containing protein [Chryseobacterium sp. PS-8]